MKEQTARMVIEGGKSATKTAKELGLDKNTVCRWVRDYRKKHNLPSYAQEKGIVSNHPNDEADFKRKIKELEKVIKEKDKKLEEEKEKIYRKKYDTIEDVKKDVFWYIEIFYNRKRRHSSLGYKTPVEYRMMNA